MSEVFVVSWSYKLDSGESGFDVELFDSFEKAMEWINNDIESEQEANLVLEEGEREFTKEYGGSYWFKSHGYNSFDWNLRVRKVK